MGQLEFTSIEEAANSLKLNWRKRLFVWMGELCRNGSYRGICYPNPIIRNGMPVIIKEFKD